MTAKTKALTLTTKPTAITTPQAVDWKRAAEDWLANLGSDRTRRAYREAWKAFIEFAQVAPDAVTQSQVIQYKTHLETAPSPKTLKPVCQATINLQLSALSSFFDFAKGRGLRADNPADGVGRKSITPYGKATWLDPDKGEDLKLLKAVDASTPQGLRDRALLLIFLTLALRVKSVADLRVGDLRRQGDAVFMKITAKGNKTREVKLPAITAAALAAWLKTRGELAPRCARLHGDRPGPGGRPPNAFSEGLHPGRGRRDLVAARDCLPVEDLLRPGLRGGSWNSPSLAAPYGREDCRIRRGAPDRNIRPAGSRLASGHYYLYARDRQGRRPGRRDTGSPLCPG